jgi:hypothetical protein
MNTRGACALLLIFVPAMAGAGTFLNTTAGKVTHAGGYAGNAGERVVDVCLDPGFPPQSGDPAQATRNAIAEFNRFQALLGNVVNGASVGLAPGQVDYESLLMHEMGHCLGLDHNLLGPSEVSCSVGGTCVNSPTLFFANTFPTIGTTLAGVDGQRATGDDVRTGATNRLWYRAGSNNPFVEPPTADRVTFVQTGSLPVGDTFAEASASFSPCSQGTATVNTGAANGQPNTTDIMVPILCTNNAIRDLSPNDRSMFRIARAGFDGIASTGDDYTVRLNYIGTTQAGCDIRIRFPSGGGFFCSVALLVYQNGDHSIDGPSPPATINLQREVNWFFNQTDTTGTPPTGCIFRHGFEDGTLPCN